MPGSGRLCQNAAMLKAGFIAIAALLISSGASAQSGDCNAGRDLVGLLHCTEDAMAVLPASKRESVKQSFLETAQSVGGNDLVRALGSDRHHRPQAPPVYPDYGWQAAGPIIEGSGVQGLLLAARNRSPALPYGRAEALLSTGMVALGTAPSGVSLPSRPLPADTADRMNAALLSLAQQSDEFDRGDLAHAAAKLAALRCDLASFESARKMTLAPGAIRYDFWRGRITGDLSALPAAIIVGANTEDTRHVRQALDGIGFLGDHGFCSS